MLFRQLTQGPANTRTNNGIFGFQTVALIYNWHGCMLIQINNGTPDLQTLVHLIWTRTGKFKHLQLSTLPFWPTCHAQSLAATNRVTEQLSWLRVERFYTSCSWSDKQAHRFSEGVTEQVPKQAHFSHLRGNYSHATSLNWNRHSFKLKLTLQATRARAQILSKCSVYRLTGPNDHVGHLHPRLVLFVENSMLTCTPCQPLGILTLALCNDLHLFKGFQNQNNHGSWCSGWSVVKIWQQKVGFTPRLMRRVGKNHKYTTPYVTVYLMFLPKLPYIHCI